MGMLSSSSSDIACVLPPNNNHQQTAQTNHNADNKADSTITTRHTNSYSPLSLLLNLFQKLSALTQKRFNSTTPFCLFFSFTILFRPTQKLHYSLPCSFRLFPLQSLTHLHQSLFQSSHHHNDNHPPQHSPLCLAHRLRVLKEGGRDLKRERAFLSWILSTK